MSKLSGKVAIVTGAAQGIGEAYARRLASAGATVVVADIDDSGADATAKLIGEAGFSARGAHVDISDPDACIRLVDEVVERDGSVDIVVNNAAIYRGLEYMPAEEIPLDVWQRMIDVNISGAYYMCRAAIPHMKRQRTGRIVNQTSEATYSASPLTLHYTLTKAAMVPLTKVLARELGDFGITVNCIAPGMIDTEATREAIPSELAQFALSFTASIKRMGQPDEVAGALEFLCSDDAAYITGQTICVGGGLTLLG